MTQEEKQTLLVDLCARLPYKPIVHAKWAYNKTDGKIKYNEADRKLEINDFYAIWDVKPYLRPMSSMMLKEAEEYNDLVNELSEYDCQPEQSTSKMVDWLNEHHFDYRGLIPMGLAKRALEGMYNTKTE